ncbi:hypothetical protein LIA77_05780 [Sarocladium implicatum]|nr:hypothetical protein LIA77_05780 [Sarocladium implicatum]
MTYRVAARPNTEGAVTLFARSARSARRRGGDNWPVGCREWWRQCEGIARLNDEGVVVVTVTTASAGQGRCGTKCKPGMCRRKRWTWYP